MPRIPTLRLVDQGSGREIEFPVERMFNGGYAGRDQEAVRKHIEDLAEIGVPAPVRIPVLYAVGNNLATTADSLQVQHERTSGEVEYALLIARGETFVAVGSDHTDRDLEAHSVEWSKQAYPNLFGPEVWRRQEVAGHWDDLVLRCWATAGGERRLYQEDSLAALLPPDTWLQLLEDLFGSAPANVAVMSGTIPSRGGLTYAEAYDLELHDPVLGRTLRHSYRVQVLREKLT